jgi:hypothetical protein
MAPNSAGSRQQITALPVLAYSDLIASQTAAHTTSDRSAATTKAANIGSSLPVLAVSDDLFGPP